MVGDLKGASSAGIWAGSEVARWWGWLRVRSFWEPRGPAPLMEIDLVTHDLGTEDIAFRTEAVIA